MLVTVDDVLLSGVVVSAADPAAVDVEIACVRRRVRVHRVDDTFYVDSALGSSTLRMLDRFPTPVGATLAPVVATGVERGVALGLGEGRRDVAPGERGWVLVGGAIASGVSLAAGVLLARRRSRGDGRWERLV